MGFWLLGAIVWFSIILLLDDSIADDAFVIFVCVYVMNIDFGCEIEVTERVPNEI